jgi:hypothetical protein
LSDDERTLPVPRHLVPRLAAAVVALTGLLLALVGVLMATTFAPESTTTGRVSGLDGVPVVATTPGMLGLDGPQVKVQVVAGPDRPVFLGVGRAADVDAYLGDVARLELTGLRADGVLTTERAGSAESLPDPAQVDVWATRVRGEGAVVLTLPDEPGRWRLVAATDGTSAGPDALTMTWLRPDEASAAPALVALGVLLLVAGAVTFGVLWSRARTEGEP